MSVRSELAAALKPLLPATVKIIDVPRSIDGMEAKRPVVLLYRESRAKAPNAMGDYFDTFALYVVTPGVDVRRSEDALDDALDSVVDALDQITWLNWSIAERSLFGENQAPAYKITLTIAYNK
jgi:hypothetical protein